MSWDDSVYKAPDHQRRGIRDGTPKIYRSRIN